MLLDDLRFLGRIWALGAIGCLVIMAIALLKFDTATFIGAGIGVLIFYYLYRLNGQKQDRLLKEKLTKYDHIFGKEPLDDETRGHWKE